MVKGTFGAGLDHVKEAVGGGRLVGTVEVDQVYAHNQHEHPEYHHPDGGKAFYLRDPLFQGTVRYMQHLADNLVTEEGFKLNEAMAENMENLSDRVYEQAPWEFADLRASGHPKVTSNRETVYDRAPLRARLTESELRDKSRLRNLFTPNRYNKNFSKFKSVTNKAKFNKFIGGGK